jgi:acyl-CoA thioester hydrolase
MPRPDPALLDPARYPFACEITTRYADMDPNHHLNNVAMAALFEDARVRFNSAQRFREAIGPRGGAMVASVGIDYLAQAFYPAPIVVHCAVEVIGRTSWTMAQLMIQNIRPVAFARSVAVSLDDGRPASLPLTFREQLENARLG